jgi:hypothetical protein
MLKTALSFTRSVSKQAPIFNMTTKNILIIIFNLEEDVVLLVNIGE